MDEIKTWADFGALTKEQLDAYSPEDLEGLKTSITDNEAKSVDERKKELDDSKKYGENQKIRAEKAEGKVKKDGEVDKPNESTEKKEGELSQEDLVTLIRADVHDDDMDAVKEYAAFKKIPIKEALASSTVKTIIAESVEKRKTADVTTVKTTRPGAHKKTDQEVVDAVHKDDKIPEKGSQEANDYFWSKRGGKKE